ncbi:hypothetical protein TRFO_09220 [Tritrichomonas foetus]|uniref:Glycosyltransferase 61 catalytic domain-containing protein n=1 Tax=Tritrichomonas foetus TaxID=1144522 RepID=A0A1J4JF79_9EUKA|nr:hypothetical protein TRFO_09220 [Tritrichomonas foetus]|eukprot:OHS97802.1 hypothetical protein TRFO_09220 [Tritrichomonas foetus]
MRRSVRRKSHCFFIVYFLITFIVIDYVLLFYFPYPEPDDFENPDNFVIIPTSPKVCTSIKKISAETDIITIEYDGDMPRKDPTFILSHFALSTTWLRKKIFFPLGSADLVELHKNTIRIRFYMPVVDNFSCEFYCASTDVNITKTRESLEPYILKREPVLIEASDFSEEENIEKYSRFRCHNKEVFETRWCEFRNVAYFDHHFFFFSPAIFDFPEPFLVPGPRAPPFDKTVDQLVIEPIVLQYKPSTCPHPLEPVTDFCYIYGVFHNYYMLWHTIFDFMIPLYHFMKMLNGTDTKANRRIYVRSDGVWAFHDFMKIFSTEPISIIDEKNPSILMYKGTIGIEKLEKNPDPKRTYDDSIAFQYNFNRDTAKGMREEILDELKIPANIVGNNGKPLVLLIDRGEGSRNIANIHDLYGMMVKTCDFCDVQMVKFHVMDVDDQIRLVSRASVLAGLHGSGLAHVIWMQPTRQNHTTHLIEVFPYKYTCRNWYNTAANVAGVEYHSVMNKNEPLGVHSDSLSTCWQTPKMCATLQCHDLLRDQFTNLEIDTFREAWDPIVEKLKSTKI